MLGTLLGRIVARLRDGDADDADTDGNGGHRPSRLDASVIAGHGGQVGDLDEATSELEAKARDLEAERRDS